MTRFGNFPRLSSLSIWVIEIQTTPLMVLLLKKPASSDMCLAPSWSVCTRQRRDCRVMMELAEDLVRFKIRFVLLQGFAHLF
jgi:hypothetical protein